MVTSLWRRRVATVLAVLAMAAVTGGLTVLSTAPDHPVRLPTAVAPPTPVPVPTGPDATPRDSASARVDPGADALPEPPAVRLPGGVGAGLVRTGLTPDGTLPIPDGTATASWWGADFGAERGVTLLSGHLDWAGELGPFARLWWLAPGQRVTVHGTEGRRWEYRVVDVRTVPSHAVPAQAGELFGQDGPHRLVLVTCGGAAVAAGGATDNRIVTAEPVLHG